MTKSWNFLLCYIWRLTVSILRLKLKGPGSNSTEKLEILQRESEEMKTDKAKNQKSQYLEPNFYTSKSYPFKPI